MTRRISGKTSVIEVYTYPELDRAVAERRIDSVLTNPGHYVLIAHRLGLTAPLATLAVDQQGRAETHFAGVIFVAAGQPELDSFDDLCQAWRARSHRAGRRQAVCGKAPCGCLKHVSTAGKVLPDGLLGVLACYVSARRQSIGCGRSSTQGAEMKLKTRFLLLFVAIFVAFIAITWVLSHQVINIPSQQWSRQFAERQVMFDKYCTLTPLIREIALARQMAAEPAVIEMALREHDSEERRRGLAAM